MKNGFNLKATFLCIKLPVNTRNEMIGINERNYFWTSVNNMRYLFISVP